MKTSFSHIYQETYLPKEKPEKTKESGRSLTIGLPKENQEIEKRLALTPEAVAHLVKNGYRVIIETGAGLGINYGDIHYTEAGAEITEQRKEVFGADMILMISQPSEEDIEYTKARTTVFSTLQLTPCYKKTIERMLTKKINAVGYELISDYRGGFPFVNAISEMEGICALMLASELLSNQYGGKGILLGGIPGLSPVEIVILGAGVAGTAATKAARALGATVKVFDHDINRLRDITRQTDPCLFTSNFHENVLKNALKSADVIIGSMQYYHDMHRICLPEDYITIMKKGAIIIDISVGQGRGCFETSEFDEKKKKIIYERHGVLHYCSSNISSRVARTASMAISNILVPLLLDVEDYRYLNNMVKTDAGFRSGVYLYKGNVVNPYFSSFFNLPLKNIELYLGGF